MVPDWRKNGAILTKKRGKRAAAGEML
jgi:hypothetical protein